MADYGVNIKVAVQNTQKIQDLSNQLKRTGAAVDQQNTKLAAMAGKTKEAVANVKNLNAVLAEAQKNFNKAVLGTQSFITTSKDLIATNREVTRSLEQRAAALKRIESGQAISPTLMGSAASQRQSQFAKLEETRKRALRASNRDFQQQIAQQSDLERTKAQKSLEIKKKAAEFRLSQGKKEQQLEENLKRIGAARKKQQSEMSRDRQQLQNALGKMEERSKAVDQNRTRLQQKSLRLGRQRVQAVTKEILENKKLTAEQQKQLTLQRQQSRQKLGGAISSGLIGGGFPLLFGQGGAAAAGGAIGGVAGGAIGGGFGFALSIVGTALGQAVADAEKFDKALAAVNAKARDLGSAAQASAEDVKNLAKNLGVTKDEALEVVAAFSAFESFADKQALVAIFGDDAAAFNRLAAAQKEFDLAKEIFESRDDIGNLEAQRLINMLKITDASVVELALAEARLQAEHDIAVEKARQITFMDRLNAKINEQDPFFLGALTGNLGPTDAAEFGEDRVKKLEENFIANRDNFINTLKKLLAERRQLLADVASFDPGKDPTAAESGESIEQRLRKQLAQYEKIDPFVRKRAVVEAEHRATLDKIAEVKDKIKQQDLETLAGKVRQARLDDIAAQKAEKSLRERVNAARTLAGLEMRLATAQAGLPGAFAGPFGGSERTAFLGQQEIDLELQTRNLEIQDLVNRGLTERAEKLQAARDQYELYETQILEATVAQERFAEALALTQPVTDSLFDSLIAVADGTKSAQEAFADFLRSIASMLVDAAKQMIAQYIAIGIARMFAGIPASGGGGQAASKYGTVPSLAPSLGGGTLSDPKGLFTPPTLISGRALGGAVGAGRPYMVGERGPELFVPGAQGNIVPNNAMSGSNIVVNVDASGSSVEGDSNQAAQLGKMLGAAVQAELVKQKRPGGLLAS